MNKTLDKPLDMPATSDGEFELVLGNKGLLSAFFLVIILLGIFFTMGYLIGRNSGPGDLAAHRGQQFDPAAPNPHSDSASAVAAANKPQPVEAPSKSAAAPAATTTPEPQQPAPTPQAVTAAPKSDAPKTSGKPLEVGPVTTAQPPAPAVTHSTTPVRGSSLIGEPQAGQTYVQAVAVIGKPEAEVLAEVLSKKGFHTLVASGPNDKTFRVLVGPAKDPSDVGKLKGDLEQLGFKGAFPKKY